MHTGEAVKNASAHMDDMLRASMQGVNNGRPLNAEQQKIRDETRAKVVALVREQLDWSTLEPLMVQEIVRDSQARIKAAADADAEPTQPTQPH